MTRLYIVTYMHNTSCEMPAWMHHKLESIQENPGEISTISDTQMIQNKWQKWRGTKEPLDEGERGEWENGLKLNIQKTKITVSSSISSVQVSCSVMSSSLQPHELQHAGLLCPSPSSTSWQMEGEKWKQWHVLFPWAPKSMQMVTSAMILKYTCSLEGNLWQT